MSLSSLISPMNCDCKEIRANTQNSVKCCFLKDKLLLRGIRDKEVCCSVQPDLQQRNMLKCMATEWCFPFWKYWVKVKWLIVTIRDRVTTNGTLSVFLMLIWKEGCLDLTQSETTILKHRSQDKHFQSQCHVMHEYVVRWRFSIQTYFFSRDVVCLLVSNQE